MRKNKVIFIYQAMTLTKGSVLWNGLPQSGNIASPTFGEKNQNPLNLSLDLHLSNMSDLILRLNPTPFLVTCFPFSFQYSFLKPKDFLQ
jgi:hypothetical protein